MARASVLLRQIPRSGTVYPMSELMRLIQSHLDRYGVTRATFAKRIGTTPQTVQNWKTRSTTMPKPEVLKGVAEETKIPYLIVLDAALKDAGYRDSLADDLDALKVRIARYASGQARGVYALQEYLTSPYFPSEFDLEKAHPGMSAAEIDQLIDELIAAKELSDYGNDELFDREFLHQYIPDQLGEPDELDDEAQSDASAEGGEGKEVLVPEELQHGSSIDADVGSQADDPGVGGTQDREQREDLAGS